jgi:hydroxyacylglutathione hydrolase
MPALSPAQALWLVLAGAVPLLTGPRDPAALVPGAVSLPEEPEEFLHLLASFPQEEAYLLVVDPPPRAQEVEEAVAQAGFHVLGYLAGGFAAWTEAGLPLVSVRVQAADELPVLALGPKDTLLLVGPAAFAREAWPRAEVRSYAQLWPALGRLDRSRHWYVTGATEGAALAASSLLLRFGFAHVACVLGGGAPRCA